MNFAFSDLKRDTVERDHTPECPKYIAQRDDVLSTLRDGCRMRAHWSLPCNSSLRSHRVSRRKILRSEHVVPRDGLNVFLRNHLGDRARTRSLQLLLLEQPPRHFYSHPTLDNRKVSGRSNRGTILNV